jgi:hypothetical protein
MAETAEGLWIDEPAPKKPIQPDPIAQVRAALTKADSAISAAYEQAYAEWRQHDRIAEKHDKVVYEGRNAIRAAIPAIDTLGEELARLRHERDRWKGVAESAPSWEVLWAEQSERAEAAESALADAKAEVERLREARHYLDTHADNVLRAMEIARDAAEVSPPDVDDRAYWEHEIRALRAALGEAPAPAVITVEDLIGEGPRSDAAHAVIERQFGWADGREATPAPAGEPNYARKLHEKIGEATPAPEREGENALQRARIEEVYEALPQHARTTFEAILVDYHEAKALVDKHFANWNATPTAPDRAVDALRPVRELSDLELAAELTERGNDWDAVRADDEGHGGSPGEWIIERIDEIEAEIKRRVTLQGDVAAEETKP